MTTQLPAPIENWRENHRLWEGNDLERRWLQFCAELHQRARNWVAWAYCDHQPPWLDERIFYPDEWPERSHLDRAEILGCPSPCEMLDSSSYQHGKSLLELWQSWQQMDAFNRGQVHDWPGLWNILREPFDALDDSHGVDLRAVQKRLHEWVAHQHRYPRELLPACRAVVAQLIRYHQQGNPRTSPTNWLLAAVERESDFVEEEL